MSLVAFIAVSLLIGRRRSRSGNLHGSATDVDDAMKKRHDDDGLDVGREPVERDLGKLRRLVDADIPCLIRRDIVRLIVGLSDTRIDALEAAGLFPKRVRISARAAGWKATEVFAFVASRKLAADVPPDLAGDPRRKPRTAKDSGPGQAARRATSAGGQP
jgi:prophage regulatory protein